MTGDGLADVLVADDSVITLYPSLGDAGFDPPQQVAAAWDKRRGPAGVFADGTETLMLGDMSGDGLSDLVRVRNGSVAYWPHLGYGHFGPLVTMGAAPRFDDDERFDPRRVRFADVDGSGTTDLLYIGWDGVRVCFNRSGNAWAEPHALAVFPTADELAHVQASDLTGGGTGCLAWSSPLPGESARALRYVDLLGGMKRRLIQVHTPLQRRVLPTRNHGGGQTTASWP